MVHGENARQKRAAGWGRSAEGGQERLSGEETCDKAPKNVNELDLEVEGTSPCLAGEKGKGKKLSVSGTRKQLWQLYPVCWTREGIERLGLLHSYLFV